ncbi:unnamed protein product [Arabidopsis lyrata]|nr:unnamed protein product [Arabidopsis lyrata]
MESSSPVDFGNEFIREWTTSSYSGGRSPLCHGSVDPSMSVDNPTCQSDGSEEILSLRDEMVSDDADRPAMYLGHSRKKNTVEADVPDFATDLCAKPAKEMEACRAKNKEVHCAKEEEVRRVSPREGNYNSSKKVATKGGMKVSSTPPTLGSKRGLTSKGVPPLTEKSRRVEGNSIDHPRVLRLLVPVDHSFRYDKTSHLVKMYAQAVGTLGFLEALTKDAITDLEDIRVEWKAKVDACVATVEPLYPWRRPPVVAASPAFVPASCGFVPRSLLFPMTYLALCVRRMLVTFGCASGWGSLCGRSIPAKSTKVNVTGVMFVTDGMGQRVTAPTFKYSLIDRTKSRQADTCP